MIKIFTFFTLLLITLNNYSQNPFNDLGEHDVEKMSIHIKSILNVERESFRIIVHTILSNGSRKISRPLTPADSKYIELDVKGGRYDIEQQQWLFESCNNLYNGGITIKARKAGTKEYTAEKSLEIECDNSKSYAEVVVERKKEEEIKRKNTENQKQETSSERKERLAKALNLEYWKTGEVTPVIASKGNVYGFKKLDTLQYANESRKNLGIIKSNDKFIRVTSFSNDNSSSEGFVSQHGYQLNINKLTDKNYNTPYKKETTNLKFDLPSSISINSIKETPSGYVVCSIDMVLFYDKNGNRTNILANSSKLYGKFFVDVTEIGTTGEYIIAYFDITKNGFNMLELIKYNPLKNIESKTIQVFNGFKDMEEVIRLPQRTKVHVVDDKHFIIVYNMPNNVGGIKKFSLDGFDVNTKGNSLVWERNTYVNLNWRTSTYDNGKLTLFTDSYTDKNGYSFDAFSADPSLNTAESFNKSITRLYHKTIFEKKPHDVYPQKNGDFIIFGKGEGKYKDIDVIYHYSAKMKIKGAYRLHYPLNMEAADRGYRLITPYLLGEYDESGYNKLTNESINTYEHHFGRSWSPKRNSYKVEQDLLYPNGLLYKPIPNLLTDASTFFAYHNAFDFILDGDELLIMTPFAVIKTNIKNVTPVTPNYKIMN